jgi:glycosyltransferase involved in cell wall biosynthesis
MGYEKNIYLYMKNAQAFILSSLWEDPGFVLIEAAFNNLFIISSNCKNGPSEFLQNGEGGILFQSNVTNQLKNSLQEFCKLTPKSKKNKKLKIKKSCKNYTLLNHHTKLCDEILNY